MTHDTKWPAGHLESLLAMLQTLREAPGGPALLAQIASGEEVRARLLALIDRAFVAFVHNAIDRYGRTAASDRITRLKLRLIEQRLKKLGRETDQPPKIPDAEALMQHLIAVLWAAGSQTAPKPEAAAPAGTMPSLGHLKSLQRSLESRLDGAVLANLDSIAALGSIEMTLKGVQPGELEEWREILRDASREIIEDYRELGQSLKQAQLCVREIGRHLENPAPVQNTAETAAPDRAELLRRLEAEMRRAHRHRLPLSLALIGPDHLEDIRLLVGPQAGQEIMRRYREHIAACARAYDTVAGCSPQRLLWVLPGADPQQGVRALRKAQERLGTAHYHYGGRLRPLPSFSGGVVGYEPGENPKHFLARAEVLAARAKLAGPNRIEYEKRRSPLAN